MRRLLTVAVLMLMCQSAQAALDISVVLNGSSERQPGIIFVSGQFMRGDNAIDQKTFTVVANSQPRGSVVVLESPGGVIGTALWMGREIMQRGFVTAVANNAKCTSACALVWLGGKERYMDPKARVGFHSTHPTIEVDQISHAGNTLVRTYLRHILEIRDPSVSAYLTSAPPTSMMWVTPNDLAQYGIVAQHLDLPYDKAVWPFVAWPGWPRTSNDETEELFKKWIATRPPPAVRAETETAKMFREWYSKKVFVLPSK